MIINLKKLIPMMLMLFFLSFNQCALWNLKDSLMVTAAGAEVIPFIKVWAILPCAVLITILFAFLSRHFNQEKVLYLMITGFLSFFALFAFFIYPNRDLFHPMESAAYLDSILPLGFKGLISMYRYWTFTGFYVMCELWNTMIISVLFWRFANEITQLAEASRFYSFLSFAYNVAIIMAGVVSLAITRNAYSMISLSNDAWEQNMMLITIIIIVSGLMAMGIYRWMHQNALSKENVIYENKKIQLSFVESLRHVSQSKYLICVAVIVVAYSITINLVEVVWKDQVRHLNSTALEYNHYIGNLQIFQGSFAIVMSLGMAEIIKRFGWKTAALVTPIIMLITSMLFFGILLFQDNVRPFLMEPLAIAIFLGSIQNCLSKACKYTIFDSTKEMALIPLSHEEKLMGKTAIDGVGARLGKSGGSIIHQGLLFMFASLSASTPFVGAILLIVILCWIISICSLAKRKELSLQQNCTLKYQY